MSVASSCSNPTERCPENALSACPPSSGPPRPAKRDLETNRRHPWSVWRWFEPTAARARSSREQLSIEPGAVVAAERLVALHTSFMTSQRLYVWWLVHARVINTSTGRGQRLQHGKLSVSHLRPQRPTDSQRIFSFCRTCHIETTTTAEWR